MPIDLDCVGRQSKPHVHEYTWRDQALYALGIGATREELPFLYEGTEGGMKTYPTFGVIPAFDPVFELVAEAGIRMHQVVHGAQSVTCHRSLPPEGSLTTVANFDKVYDLKRFLQLRLSTETRLDDELVQVGVWTIVVRGEGGFGGERPPVNDAPKIPKDRDPDWVHRQTTSPEQALLYRLSGDFNPLHADPAVAAEVGFEEGPILHGLATFGFIARAAIGACVGGDAGRLETIAAQFRKPVWPGDTIETRGWSLDDGRVALQAEVDGRSGAVVTNAWASFRDE